MDLFKRSEDKDDQKRSKDRRAGDDRSPSRNAEEEKERSKYSMSSMMGSFKRDKSRDGRERSRDRTPEKERSPEKESEKFSMSSMMDSLKRDKSSDGRKPSKDRHSQKERSQERPADDGKQNGKASMSSMLDSFGRKKDKDDRNDDRSRSENRSPEKEQEVEKENEKESMTDKVTTFMKPYIKDARVWTAEQASDAKKDLQRYAGLGHRPDVVPPGKAFAQGEPRTVELGWHPVAGATGKWFAEKTIIGNKITEKIGKYPDPTQHWAVIVGDYVHQLWMDGNLDVIYINEKLKREDWHMFEVGKTRFNDQALREASKMTIHNMRTARPAYNLISNNCQNFAVNLLKNIQTGATREFGTTFAVYQRATGQGTIMDLFSDKPDAEKLPVEDEKVGGMVDGKPKRQDTAMFAQQLMDENTPKLDLDGDGRPG